MATAFALAQHDTLLARAESLLAAGELRSARRLVERLDAERPNDPKALTLLGRIHLAWPVTGRFRAESLFARAAALDPASPEPFYYLGLVGLRLGGDDGEAIARRGLVRVLALNPSYRDGWALWSSLYRGGAERNAAVRALEHHAGSYAADLWRAGLLVELGRYDEAMPILEALARRRPRDPAPRALRAQVLYEQGRDDDGGPQYEAALALAPGDTGAVLWHQIRSITTPADREEFAAQSPEGREAFYRRFWARREPNLRTPVNERIGEHFRRLAEARRVFTLLHPLSRYHHSRAFRTLAGGLGPPAGVDLRAIAGRISEFRPARVADAAVTAGQGGRLDPDSDLTANLEDGLDDRGRVFARYGVPDERFVWSGDAETWRYYLAGGHLQVTFVRRTGGYGYSGDLVLTPVVAGELESARYLLSTDRPERRATLRFEFWHAAFRVRAGGLTELLLFPDSARAVAALVDTLGREVARDSATERLLRLVVPPGPYLLALDADHGDRSGRYRAAMLVPRYASDSLAVSSLLVADGDVGSSRTALERAAPPGLRLRAARPMRFYAEVYGLGDRDGMVRYEAVYRFERAGRRGFLGLGSPSGPTTISFRREQAARETVYETLIVDPGRLPSGRYRLRLEVTDLIRRTRAASAGLEFDLR